MRRINALITPLLLVLFLVHVVAGSLQVIGVLPGGVGWLTGVAHTALTLVAAHMAIGVALTVQTFRAQRAKGATYWRENRLFWVRRLSGLALALLIAVHFVIFLGTGTGSSYRLTFFGPAELASQLLMVVALVLHVVSNVRPQLIALGIPRRPYVAGDVMAFVSGVLLVAGVAFVVYFLRWLVV